MFFQIDLVHVFGNLPFQIEFNFLAGRSEAWIYLFLSQHNILNSIPTSLSGWFEWVAPRQL